MQMLDEGFYHADPHPGNLLKMSDGRLAYLDFGVGAEAVAQVVVVVGAALLLVSSVSSGVAVAVAL